MIEITPLDSWIKKKIKFEDRRSFKKQLAEYTLKKLQENLNYVREKSRFYSRKLNNFSQINSLADFEKLPFTSAEDIKNESHNFVCINPTEISRIVTMLSSGTSGKRKRIFFNEGDQELTVDFFEHGMSTLVGAEDRVLILMPGETPGSIGALLTKALDRIGCSSDVYGPVDNPAEVLKIIENKNITSLVAIPIQVLKLLRRYEEDQDNINIELKSILLSTDYAADSLISQLEEVWECSVYDHYGMTEMGLGGGVFCSAFKGYHLREADLYFEIIDPETAEVLPEGELGEVVFTTLTREAMPLIRYRTGDFSRFLKKKCSCGSDLKILDKIRYRRIGLIRLSNSKEIKIADFDEQLLNFKEIKDYAIQLSREDNYDKLMLLIDIIDDLKKEELNRLKRKIFVKLKVITSLNELIKKNKLKLKIKESSNIKNISDGRAKRQIIDKR